MQYNHEQCVVMALCQYGDGTVIAWRWYGGGAGHKEHTAYLDGGLLRHVVERVPEPVKGIVLSLVPRRTRGELACWGCT